MIEGNFNPFKTKPKEEPKKQIEKKDSHIKLDGGTYVLVFKNTELQSLKKKLGLFITDLQKTYPKEMLTFGIQIIPLGDHYKLDALETSLKTPIGHIIIYIGDNNKNKIEDAAFNRLGYAAYKINDQKLLKKHNAKLIVRSQ